VRRMKEWRHRFDDRAHVPLIETSKDCAIGQCRIGGVGRKGKTPLVHRLEGRFAKEEKRNFSQPNRPRPIRSPVQQRRQPAKAGGAGHEKQGRRPIIAGLADGASPQARSLSAGRAQLGISASTPAAGGSWQLFRHRRYCPRGRGAARMRLWNYCRRMTSRGPGVAAVLR